MPPRSLEENNTESLVPYSRCTMYITNYTEVIASGRRQANPDWAIGPCQHGWDFNLTNIPYLSIAAEVSE